MAEEPVLSTDARTSDPVVQHLCDAKRAADGKLCGKPAEFKQIWDHPERFPQRFFCGLHARHERVEPLCPTKRSETDWTDANWEDPIEHEDFR